MTKTNDHTPRKQLQRSSSASARNRRGPRTTPRQVRRKSLAERRGMNAPQHVGETSNQSAMQPVTTSSTTQNDNQNTIAHTPSKITTTLPDTLNTSTAENEAPNSTPSIAATNNNQPLLPQETNHTPTNGENNGSTQTNNAPTSPPSTEHHEWAPRPESIFLAKPPIMRHIPSRTRRFVSEAFAREWWRFVKAQTPTARHKALLRIFAFAPCILLQMPKHRLCDTQPQHKSPRLMVRHRLRKWLDGKAAELWENTRSRGQPKPRKQEGAEPQRRTKLRRAVATAQEGAFAKAIRTLRSSGIHEPTAEVERALLKKHPQNTPTTDGDHNLPPATTLPPIPPQAVYIRRDEEGDTEVS